LPAMAVSQEINGSKGANGYNTAAAFAEDLAENIAENGLPFGTLLNVNIPDLPEHEIAGVRVSSQNIRSLPEYYEKRLDPRNTPYHWLGVDPKIQDAHPESDGAALAGKYISVTPIKCDTTDYGLMEQLRAWRFDHGRFDQGHFDHIRQGEK